ncbi:MAG: hypothetical protein RQ761_09205 [Bacteroidales bacterium]|nr:hypothetical protein [Bacteroidales bacterium]
MTKLIFITGILLLSFLQTHVSAQSVIVSDDPAYTNPADGAVLDVKSTTKGFIVPRMTTAQRTTLGSTTPVNGVVVYDTDMGSFWYWKINAWQEIAASNLNLQNIRFGDADNYSTFEADGTLLMIGNARVWNDFVVPGSAAKVGSVNPPAFIAFVDGIYTLAFSGGNNNYDQVFLAIQMPHDWDEGTAIEPHVHWSPAAVTTATEVVNWNFEYVWQDYESVFPSASQKINNIAGDVVASFRHNMTSFGLIDATGMKISSILMCRLWRNGHTDSYNDNAFLLSFDIHYQTNTIGSRDQYIK